MVLEETEKELIEGCQRGESEAFRALFELYKDRVYSIALRYSGDPATAMDIAQECFLKLFSGIRSFRWNSQFETWLYRLVVNTCFDQKRRVRRLIPLVEDVVRMLRAPEGNALDQAVRSQLNSRVQSVVERLPPDQRMVIVLRYTQGLSYEEMGEILGCSSGTIGSRLNRVHKVLEKKLSGLVKNRGEGYV